VIYQHPLGYLLGLQGVALLRAFNGEYDRNFIQARFAEVRALIDSAAQFGEGVTSRQLTTEEAYAIWAARYDTEGNDLFDMDGPVIYPITDRLPPGVALDAACGTGRHAARLAALGHTVIGVDISREMLALASAKVPAGDFRRGDLSALPVPDRHVDLIVCSLALTHVPDLAAVFAEFARVLRPGGHLVICDSRMDNTLIFELPEGGFGYLPHYRRATSEYLTAALPLGLQVRHCEELRFPVFDPADVPPDERVLPDNPGDIWTLRAWYRAASRGALAGQPLLIFWHFQLA
jgi:ubiquinone/menaquinone biosynthesis C-methylase UbiE